jgi:CspA family cold shock protein
MSEDKTYTGTVVWFSNTKGYGFVQWDKDNEPQTDLFMYFSDIVCDGFKSARKGDVVSFQIGANNRGQPKAINIVKIK